MEKNLSGVLNKRGEYHFLTTKQLIQFFIKQNYPRSVIVVFYKCIDAFNLIPKLDILKRDDYDTYLCGMAYNFVLIEFESVEKAEDLVFSIPSMNVDKVQYGIFYRSILIRDEKGLKEGVVKRWLKGEILKEKSVKN